MESYKTNDLARCPSCNTELTGASGEGGHNPNPGDLSVCVYCAAVLVFIDDLTVRELSTPEFDGLTPENKKQIITLRRAVQAMNRADGANQRD